MAMEKVATVEVGSGGAASIEITNIPATGKDLLILASLRLNSAVVANTVGILLNGSFAGSARRLRGDGFNPGYSSESNLYVTQAPGTSATSNTFGNMAIYIRDYTSTANKTIVWDSVTENNSQTATSDIIAAVATSSAAITTVEIENPSANLLQYSSASVYIIS